MAAAVAQLRSVIDASFADAALKRALLARI
jgi:hypothetical protein